MLLPLYINWSVDFIAALVVIILSLLILKTSYNLYRSRREIMIYHYIFIQSIALFVFATGRGIGHIAKRILLLYGLDDFWETLSPISGSVNTLTIAIFPLIALLYADFSKINQLLVTLKREKNRYKSLFLYKQAIFDAMLHPALVIMKDFTIADVNKAYETTYDCKKSDIIGRKCYEISHGYSTPCETKDEPCPLRLVEETRKGHIVRHNHIRADEKRVIEISASPILDQEGRFLGIIEITKDITDELLAEQERQRLTEELYEMRKHMALRTAIGGIAHEFNNLLAAILGNTELLLLKLGETFADKKRLLTIKKAAERASQLIRKMMIYEKADFFNKNIIDINELIESLIPELKTYLTEKISLICSLDPNVQPIYADTESLKQAITNVFINAVESMKQKGGKLTIRTYKRIVNDVQYTCIEIQDTGVGIPSEHLSRIFDPFFTTKDVGEGEGLGLSVVKGIVDAHQGFIEVDSSEGKGSRFHLCFISVPSKRT
ncbi:MAG: PAS domain-containing protein [Nitrospirae bacterium]|nr:PAS domain-containing protein [Nitrospirota bacterium]